MDRQPILEGERVTLRPMRADDWKALYAIASDPAVWEQHPIHDRWREEVFAAFFAEALEEKGALVVIDRASDTIVGSSQFREGEDEDGEGNGEFEPSATGTPDLAWVAYIVAEK